MTMATITKMATITTITFGTTFPNTKRRSEGEAPAKAIEPCRSLCFTTELRGKRPAGARAHIVDDSSMTPLTGAPPAQALHLLLYVYKSDLWAPLLQSASGIFFGVMACVRVRVCVGLAWRDGAALRRPSWCWCRQPHVLLFCPVGATRTTERRVASTIDVRRCYFFPHTPTYTLTLSLRRRQLRTLTTSRSVSRSCSVDAVAISKT